ncbi:PIN domain-containing protein [uncultured Paludibaculum sp.]|uniref:PIN domain-containing protein n=1 Tax=uncultured Paludibaculum sp. TaxID=1765020 RepID=UPI002AAB334D|nr:PIN domain-containing protein [uncultured Paludibaculum sp.]
MDTSVLVAGISGFRTGTVPTSNPSAQLLRDWLERGTFTWLVSEEILDEYKTVLRRLKVRRETIGLLVNLLREEAETVVLRARRKISPDPADDPFCACAEDGAADFLVTLNPRDLPQAALAARVLAPGTPLPARRGSKRR